MFACRSAVRPLQRHAWIRKPSCCRRDHVAEDDIASPYASNRGGHRFPSTTNRPGAAASGPYNAVVNASDDGHADAMIPRASSELSADKHRRWRIALAYADIGPPARMLRADRRRL